MKMIWVLKARAGWNPQEMMKFMFILTFPTLLTGILKGEVGICLYSTKRTPGPEGRNAEKGDSIACPKLLQ